MSFVAPISQGLAYHRRIKSDIGSHAISLSQGSMSGGDFILADTITTNCQEDLAARQNAIDKDLIEKHATYLPIKP